MSNRKAKLTQRVVAAAEPEAQPYIVADTEISGFRLRVQPTGKKSFYLYYRAGGGGRGAKQCEPRIGDFPAMKTEAARRIALEWSAQVRTGGDPSASRKQARTTPRMNDLFDRYLADYARLKKKVTSLRDDERRIEKRLRAKFGRERIIDVTRQDITAFHNSLRDKPYEANRCLALLSKIFNLAEQWGLRPDHTNPCHHVSKFPEEKRERYLSHDELDRLGEVLRFAETECYVELPANAPDRPKAKRVAISLPAINAIRLLLFTGMRLNEVLRLQWAWVDLEQRRFNLPDSKTGRKTLPIPAPAVEVLRGIERREDNPHVVIGGKPGAHLVNLKDPWAAICEAANLQCVRLHDLRHTFASTGVSLNQSLTVVGKVLGHSQPQTTARYAHLQDNPYREAGDQIAHEIYMRLNGNAARPREIATTLTKL